MKNEKKQRTYNQWHDRGIFKIQCEKMNEALHRHSTCAKCCWFCIDKRMVRNINLSNFIYFFAQLPSTEKCMSGEARLYFTGKIACRKLQENVRAKVARCELAELNCFEFEKD